MDNKGTIIPQTRWTSNPVEVFNELQETFGSSLIFFPTSTLWSLGCLPNEEVISKLKKLKKRSAQKPFLLLWEDVQDLHNHLIVPQQSQQDFLQKYLGQSVTFLIPREWFQHSDWIPKACISKDKKIAVRVDPLPLLRKLIQCSGAKAWLSTSVNFPGDPPEPIVDENSFLFQSAPEPKILFEYRKRLEGKPSTVVDVVEKKVIREGSVKILL
jgi:L-threonylcarbamoyladenylate synthase